MGVIKEDWKKAFFAERETSQALGRKLGPLRSLVEKLLIAQREAEDDTSFAEAVDNLLDNHPGAAQIKDSLPPDGLELCKSCHGTGIDRG